MASGFAIADGELLELEIPVDIGETEVGGRVVSEWGEPIAGAEVTLAWRAIDGGQSSRSIRAAATGADGQFEFQGLDAGSRLLKVAAPGFQPREMAVENLDQEVEVQLYANNEDGY